MGTDYGGTGQTSNPSPVNISMEDQKKLQAALEVNAINIANAKLGANHAKHATVTMAFTPYVASDIITDAQQVMAVPACKGKVTTLRGGNRKVKFLSLVTSVAEVTVDYAIEVSTDTTLSAGVSKDLAKTLGASGDATLETGSSTKIHVSGAKLIGNYNSDDDVLTPMLR